MYIRFITTYRDERGYAGTGVFQALGFLSRSEQTFEYDRDRVNDLRWWFGNYLDRPARFNKHSRKHVSSPALCWFKCSATRHIGHMY